jgi:outer membrane protein
MIKLLSFLLLFTLSAWGQRNDLPLYDIGVLAGTGFVPDYPAASQGRVRYIIFPSFIYRGETWRNDENQGARARLFNSDNFLLDMSVGGAFPANSDENKARDGMDDLDWLLQAGPRVSWRFFNDKDMGELLFRFEIQYTISTNFEHTQHRGFRYAPTLSWDVRQVGSKYLDFFGRLLVNYGSEKLNDYFYEVPSEDVTSIRPRFNARSGYISSDIFLGFNYTFHRRLNYFGGVTYSDYRNATNEESYLHQVNDNTTLFFGFSYYFFSSSERAYN